MVGNLGENLIFIFSLPRSGSTLLSAILGSNLDVCAPPEPWILLKLHYLNKNACLSAFYDDELATSAINDAIDESMFVDASRQYAVSIYNSLLAKNNKNILVDKTPRYHNILNYIDRLFPKAKKIWLKRNPLDVAASYKTTWDIDTGVFLGDKITRFSYDFFVGMRNLSSYFDDANEYKFEIKYEDIVTNPDMHIKKLCEFCNLEYSDSMLEYNNSKNFNLLRAGVYGDKKIMGKKKVNTESINSWEKVLRHNDCEFIATILGKNFMRRLGYDELANYFNKIDDDGYLDKFDYKKEFDRYFASIKYSLGVPTSVQSSINSFNEFIRLMLAKDSISDSRP